MNYLVINTKTGLVENAAVWDGVTPWAPGKDYAVAKCADYAGVWIGRVKTGDKFNDLPAVQAKPMSAVMAAAIAAAGAKT